MDMLYEMIFLGLFDASRSNKMPMPIRIVAAVLVLAVFAIAFAGLVVVAVVDGSIIKRIIYGILAAMIVWYCLVLFKRNHNKK